MIAYFAIGVGLLLVLVAAGHAFTRADPKRVACAAKGLAIALAVLGGGFLLVTGRLGYAIALMTMLLPLALQLTRAWRQGKTFARMGGFGGGARQSTVETEWLRMTLDHASNDVDGEILKGRFAGRTLNALDQAELRALWREIGGDGQARRLLEAYLDRRFMDWREEAEEAAADEETPRSRHDTTATAMSLEDAYRILGLAPGASDQEIREAHHRLIQAVHPDRGGSDYLAAQINRARDLLLADAKRR